MAPTARAISESALYSAESLRRIAECGSASSLRDLALAATGELGFMSPYEDEIRTGSRRRMAHDLVTRDLLAREVAMLAIDRLVEDDLRTSAVRWLEHNIRYERLCVDISRKLSELQDLVVHIIVDLSK